MRVLELADEKLQYCGKLLADLGADVLLIEPPEGAAARRWGPFYQDTPDPNRSIPFWFYNTSKRSMTLDVASPSGGELFKRIAADADVVLEAHQPGWMASHGLGWDTLHALAYPVDN